MAVYFYIAMEIKDTQGNILFDVPVTQLAVLTEELMKQYGITLGWNAVTADVLPVGAYIEHNGVRYSLLEPYSPTQKDEATYEYSPVFQHPVMRWGKALFFFYTYSGGSIVSKELDWSLTDNPANFMSAICDAIENETGEKWSYEVASDLAASASLSFSNTDILSGLNSIAGVFKTEWWFDYANKIVYLSKAGHGSAVTLEVGQNVGVPQVTQNKEGYYTRFYGFGSTRNIDQSYAGANVNSIVNRRLTLDPAKYPNGYIDIREGLTQEEVLPVPLVFDDIYPRSSLTISDVKVRMMWRLDDNSQKVQIGTDSEGNPVYDQYAIWYFKIPGFAFSKNLLISGKSLSAHFNSGSLNGREFELTYHDKGETLSNSDGTDFVVEAGDYEINFVEEGSYIIPAVTGLIPAEGDAVTLFNIIMPEEYKASAYAELEEAVRKRMAQQGEDRNNYTFESNKVAFYESNPNLSIGRLVTFVNGSNSISTRVIKLETQLDYPFEQRITVGNAIIKGSQQTLKEEVVNANQNIDLLAAINESSEAFQQSLQRTQKAVLESIAKMPDLGLSLVEQDGKTWLRSEYDFFSEGEVSSGGASDTEGEGGSGGSVVTVEQIVTDANGVSIAKINVDGVPNIIYAPRTAEVDLTGYATTDYVDNAIQNAKDARVDTLINTTIPELQSDLTALQTSHNALRNDFDALNTLLNDDVSEKIDTWNEVVDFLDEYSGSQDLATILSVMNADIAKRALQTSLDATNANLNNHIDTFNTFVDATNNTLSSHNNRIKTFEDMFEWDGENIKAKASFYSVGEVSSGGLSDTGGSTGGNTVSWAGAYESGNLLGTLYIDGVANTILGPTALPNPYALTINGEVYDGSKAVDITISGGTAGSISWDAIMGKPTTLFDWQGYLWNSNTSAYDLYQNGVYSYAGGVTGNNWPSEYGILANLGSGNNANKMQFFETSWGVLLHRVKFDSDSCDWRVILDSANCGNYALPITGGKLNGKLEIESTNWGNQLMIICKNNTPSVMMNDGAYDFAVWPGIRTQGNDWYLSSMYAGLDSKVLHQHNYSSYALPLSGGSMNDDARIIFKSSNTYGASSWLLFAYGSTFQIKATTYGSNTSDDTPIIQISNSGELYNNGNAVIHSGNIGSQSVNYANSAGNASSASKLASSRTIWGQPFDGTGNVDGLMVSTGTNTDIGMKVKGSTYELLFCIGSGNVNRGIYDFNNSSWLMYRDATKNVIFPQGNILIGTTYDIGHKLYVAGTGGFNECVSIGTKFTTSGNPNAIAAWLKLATPGHTGSDAWVIAADDRSTASSFLCIGYDINTLSFKFEHNGNFVATGEVTSGSDVRYKRIESYAKIDISTIANAPIINFRWTDREDDKLHLGSTAQYWYNTSLLNGVSPTDDEKLWTMGYGQIALASAVSIAKKVVNHEDRLQIVEKELAYYKEKSQMLEQQLNQYRYGIQ